MDKNEERADQLMRLLGHTATSTSRIARAGSTNWAKTGPKQYPGVKAGDTSFTKTPSTTQNQPGTPGPTLNRTSKASVHTISREPKTRTAAEQKRLMTAAPVSKVSRGDIE